MFTYNAAKAVAVHDVMPHAMTVCEFDSDRND